MDKTDLKNKIEHILDMPNPGVRTYFGMKNGNMLIADIVHEAEGGLVADLKTSLTKIKEYMDSDEFVVKDVTQADARKHAAYIYSLDDKIDAHKYFELIKPNTSAFSKDIHEISNINALIYKLGSDVDYAYIYRKVTSFNIIKRERKFWHIGDEQRWVPADKDMLQLDTCIDYIKFHDSDELIIFNIDTLEHHDKFLKAIKNRALTNLGALQHLNLVRNIADIETKLDKPAIARKVAKLQATSPVFSLPPNEIVSFIKGHQKLQTVLVFDEQDKLSLSSDKKINAFLRVLNDEYLKSLLTNIDYVSPAKDRL